MKPKKSMIMMDNTEDEEEEALLDAEEARIRASQLEKELEEQNKFDCLCDGVMSCLSLVDASFNEILELKDELLQHDLPPSLLVAITLSMGKMFRSITDLHTPIQELTRLVNIYSIPWEQRSEALKKLHNDYESKQRQLNIAIRRLQLIDAHTKRLDTEKRIMNWEKAFAKVTSANSHGRRWKFMIEAFKKKIRMGVNLSEMEVELSDDEAEYGQVDDDNLYADDGVSDKQRFMLSVIAASPPVDDDGTPQAGSDIGSEGDGVPSEISDSTANVEDVLPDIKRRDASFRRTEKHEVGVEIRPEVKEKAVWTHEPKYHTQLAIRLFRPLFLKDDDGSEVAYSVSFAGSNIKTPGLSLELENPGEERKLSLDDSEMEEAKIKVKKKSGRRKSIGFASNPLSPPSDISSPSKKNLPISKSGGILKKMKSDSDESTLATGFTGSPQVNREIYEQVIFDVPENCAEPIRIALLQGEQKMMVAMLTVPWDDVQNKNVPIQWIGLQQYDLSENVKPDTIELQERELFERSSRFEQDLSNQELLMLDLQGIKLGIGGHSHGKIGQLPVQFHLVKQEQPRFLNAVVNTLGVKELILDATGIDIEQVSKDELLNIFARDYRDNSTSAMSFVSSSSHKSGYIPVEELEVIREQHDIEVKNIQDEYEAKLQQLLVEVGKLQATRTNDPGITGKQPSQEVKFAEATTIYQPSNLTDSLGEREDQRLLSVRWRPPKIPNLPVWGARLPDNVWHRMKMIHEEMSLKREQLEIRIRNHIAVNIEKKLASQYKLQRTDKSVHGPLQDVSLPAIFMPSKVGNVYNPRARMYFHPTGTSSDLRLTQPPSIFQLPPLPEKAKMSIVNLFELSKNFEQPTASDWFDRIAPAHSRGSRTTTAGSRRTPHTPAPTANIRSSDVYT